MAPHGSRASQPHVSVIIPYHNEGDLLRRALESVCAQTYPGPIEIVVIDDGSNVPPAIHGNYRHSISLVRSRGGLYAGGARNLGVKHARGEIICFLDADDAYRPERIEDHVRFLSEHPDVILVGGKVTVHRGEVFTKSTKVISWYYPDLEDQTGVLPEAIRCDCCADYMFHTGAITLRRQTFNLVGGFDCSYRWGEEWDLQVRLAQLGRIGYVPGVAVDYLCREGSICSTVNPMKFEAAAAMFTSWRRLIRGLPGLHHRSLRKRAHESLLLATQIYLEHEHNPGKALSCAWSAQYAGLSVWGCRSLIRSALHMSSSRFYEMYKACRRALVRGGAAMQPSESKNRGTVIKSE